LGYKVKRGSTSKDNTIKEMLVAFFKRLIGMLIIFAIIAAFGYFLFQFAYHQYPPFAKAADDVMGWFKSFYLKHGIWATLGLIVFICIAVWALGEEARRKERQKETIKEMLK
jgi:predicted membrane protein